MTKNKGVIVSGFIRPTSELDTYPTHVDTYGMGGYRCVPTLDVRDSISIDRRKLGMCVYVLSESKLYILIDRLDNTGWQPFLIDGNTKLNLLEDYIYVGNRLDKPEQSPLLQDVRLDLINLRFKLRDAKKLKKGYLIIGDTNDIQTPTQQINVNNLPTLGAANFDIPLLDLKIPIPNPTFNPLSPFAYIMSAPWLSQVYAGSTNLTNTSRETVISSAFAAMQIDVAQALKRLDNANFIVGSKTLTFTWENPIYSAVTDPTLIAAMQLYNLNPSYTFSHAQSLGDLETGLIKNTVTDNVGEISKAIPGEDYVDAVILPEGNLCVLDPQFPLTPNHKLISPMIGYKARPNFLNEFGYTAAGLVTILEGLALKISKLAVTGLPNALLLKTNEFGELVAALGDIDFTTPAKILEVVALITALELFVNNYVLNNDTKIATIQAKDIEQDVQIAAAPAAGAALASAAFDAKMLPYSAIPLVPVGISISVAIAAAVAAAAAAQSDATTARDSISSFATNFSTQIFTATQNLNIPVWDNTSRPDPHTLPIGSIGFNTSL